MYYIFFILLKLCLEWKGKFDGTLKGIPHICRFLFTWEIKCTQCKNKYIVYSQYIILNFPIFTFYIRRPIECANNMYSVTPLHPFQEGNLNLSITTIYWKQFMDLLNSTYSFGKIPLSIDLSVLFTEVFWFCL